MTLAVESTWDDRDDDRLVALPDGAWASATDRALARWTADGPGTPLVTDDPSPGPLLFLSGPQRLAWGPTVSEGGGPTPASLVVAALADVGSGAARQYALSMGTVDATGATAYVALRYQPPRVAGSKATAPGPRTRVALVDLVQTGQTGQTGQAGHALLRSILADDLDEPTAVSWGDGPLLIGLPGRLLIGRLLSGRDPAADDESSLATVALTTVALTTSAAPRALAVGPDGVAAAGLADGSVVTWDLDEAPGPGRDVHIGPVLALAWAPDGRALATGGDDGRVRAGTGSITDEIDLGDPVTALAWLDDGRIVAKAGRIGGRIVLLRRTP